MLTTPILSSHSHAGLPLLQSSHYFSKSINTTIPTLPTHLYPPHGLNFLPKLDFPLYFSVANLGQQPVILLVHYFGRIFFCFMSHSLSIVPFLQPFCYVIFFFLLHSFYHIYHASFIPSLSLSILVSNM